MASEVTVAGVDGTRGGWVAAVVPPPPGRAAVRVEASLAELWEPGWQVVGIDMPMGLPRHDRRSADAEARRLLGPRRSCVFPTPVHPTLAATDYPDALVRSREACGRGLPKQAFHLLPKIREVRAWLGGPRSHVHEVHPETSFTVMNGSRPLAPKVTAEGRQQRRRLVADWNRSLSDAVGELPGALVVDGLDAAAAAWTATRIAAGTHRVLGDDRQFDPDGYPLTIVV